MTKYLMPAGEYYVGDLCYTLGRNDETWDEVCALMFPAGTEWEHCGKDGKHRLADGREFCEFGTAYGDGSYRTWSAQGQLKDTCVDSGSIGVMLTSALPDMDLEEAKRLGNILTFQDDFICYDDNGSLHFGHVTIETRDDNEFDNEDEDHDSDCRCELCWGEDDCD